MSFGVASLVPDFPSSELLGVGVAIALIIALRVLLPAASRPLLRQPVFFLLLHVGVRVIVHALPEGALRAQMSLVALVLVLASIGRASVLLVLDVILGQRISRPLPQIIRDITQGLVYVAVLLTALRMAGVEPGSILTTSALLTAVVALSLQETLGNMVAGLAIQVQHPFDIDDWIQFDSEPKHIGRVLEINWRATKVITLDLVEVIVPNATLAKAPIVNFTKPTTTSRRSLYVQAPASFAPHKVQSTILEALGGSFGLVKHPAPSVVTNAFIDGNVEYWVRFFSDQFDKRDGVDGAARDRIWYAFARAGIPLAFTNRSVHLHEVSTEERAGEELRLNARETALKNVDFLRVLPDDLRHKLAAESRIYLYGAGESIVRQGDDSSEMFIVESGEVLVLHEPTNGQHAEVELARLGPGKFFGEMALVAGERRTATVRARTPCTLIGIDQRALRPILGSAPEIAEHVSQVIAERQAMLAEHEAAASKLPSASVQERSSLLLGRIRKFFAL